MELKQSLYLVLSACARLEKDKAESDSNVCLDVAIKGGNSSTDETFHKIFTDILSQPEIQSLFVAKSTEEMLRILPPKSLNQILEEVYSEYWHSSYLSTTQLNYRIIEKVKKLLGTYPVTDYVYDENTELRDLTIKNETDLIGLLWLYFLVQIYSDDDVADHGWREVWDDEDNLGLSQCVFLLRTTAQLLEQKKSLRKTCGLTDLDRSRIMACANTLRAFAGELIRFNAGVQRASKDISYHLEYNYYSSWEFHYQYQKKIYSIDFDDLTGLFGVIRVVTLVLSYNALVNSVPRMFSLNSLMTYILKNYVQDVDNEEDQSDEVEEDIFMR